MVDLYPPIEPHERGMLAVGEGNEIAWEVSGAPDGKPAVVLHGGPGQGSSPNMRRAFDPARYRIVLFDQRGCGRSIPHASDPATNMAFNTTERLVGDLEKLRAHLGIDRWLVAGGSWGCALALAYGQRYPSRVTEMVLVSVTTFRQVEAEWLYGGLALFLPEAWARFRGQVLESGGPAEVIAAYARRMEDPDPALRLAAARAWCAWEDAVLGLEPGSRDGSQVASFSGLPAEEMLAFVRICAHYLRHRAWLEEGLLISEAGRLAGIPGVLIHGRLDFGCPIETAWELARTWPGSELIAVEDAGHLPSAAKRRALLGALDRFARPDRGRRLA